MGGKRRQESIRKSDAFSGDIPKPSDNGPGTYRYVQSNTGQTYIGSTLNNYRRFINHTSSLCRGKHGNRKFQKAFDKDPHFDYRFEPVQPAETVTATLQKVRTFEAGKIEGFEDKSKLLNLSLDPFATGKLEEVSEETRRKISEKMRGRTVSQETRRRQALATAGQRHSDETKHRLSLMKETVPVEVDGVSYRCAADAARALGFKHKGQVRHRCLSDKFPNYRLG